MCSVVQEAFVFTILFAHVNAALGRKYIALTAYEASKTTYFNWYESNRFCDHHYNKGRLAIFNDNETSREVHKALFIRSGEMGECKSRGVAGTC